MKLAPVDRELARRRDVEHVIVHTGQHYDPEMSDLFSRSCGFRARLHLGVGRARMRSRPRVMQRLEPILTELRPDLVLVYGDVNSTLAAALVASKLGRRVGHVEAGLRSGDWSMPEEINRVVTDRLSDLLLTPSRDAGGQLGRRRDLRGSRPFRRNVMIDSLCWALPQAAKRDVASRYEVRAWATRWSHCTGPRTSTIPRCCVSCSRRSTRWAAR